MEGTFILFLKFPMQYFRQELCRHRCGFQLFQGVCKSHKIGSLYQIGGKCVCHNFRIDNITVLFGIFQKCI